MKRDRGKKGDQGPNGSKGEKGNTCSGAVYIHSGEDHLPECAVNRAGLQWKSLRDLPF